VYNASKNGHVTCLSQLLAARGDASALCCDGTSPLDIALKNGHSGCVRLLMTNVELNANKNSKACSVM